MLQEMIPLQPLSRTCLGKRPLCVFLRKSAQCNKYLSTLLSQH